LWEDLDESRRESSRAQARHIAVKLHIIGCAVTPLRRWDATDFTFTDEEVEKLAKAEHDRWWDERLADGWTLMDLKDVDDPVKAEEAKRRKQSPHLVAFKDLPPKIADYDRIFVREMPRRLASGGLQVIRTRTTPTPATEQASTT
jgi:hypothetical protein